jgi:hypothetical protein
MIVMTGKVVTVLAYTIISIWAATIVVSMMRPSYSPPTSVQWAMSVLAGAAFGRKAAEASRLKDDE